MIYQIEQRHACTCMYTCKYLYIENIWNGGWMWSIMHEHVGLHYMHTTYKYYTFYVFVPIKMFVLHKSYIFVICYARSFVWIGLCKWMFCMKIPYLFSCQICVLVLIILCILYSMSINNVYYGIRWGLYCMLYVHFEVAMLLTIKLYMHVYLYCSQ